MLILTAVHLEQDLSSCDGQRRSSLWLTLSDDFDRCVCRTRSQQLWRLARKFSLANSEWCVHSCSDQQRISHWLTLNDDFDSCGGHQRISHWLTLNDDFDSCVYSCGGHQRISHWLTLSDEVTALCRTRLRLPWWLRGCLPPWPNRVVTLMSSCR